MDTLGGINFFRIDGNVLGYGQQLEDISKPHESGVALRRTGKKAPQVQLTAVVDVKTMTDVKALEFTTLPAIKGTLVSLLQGGVSRDNVAILDFKIQSVVFCALMIGGVNVEDGNSGYWVTIQFQVQHAGVPS